MPPLKVLRCGNDVVVAALHFSGARLTLKTREGVDQ